MRLSDRPGAGSAATVLAAFARLGLSSFGGPVAHLGYFRAEFVTRRGWLDDAAYADLVALCQFLPGPASSQVGIAIGHRRAGLAGALAAWIGFTLPSALALVLFAFGLERYGASLGGGWLHGLEIAAAAVVAQAVWGMGRTMAQGRGRATLAVAACAAATLWPNAAGQVGAIACAGLVGWRWFDAGEGAAAPDAAAAPAGAAPAAGPFALLPLLVFAALLVGLPLLARVDAAYPLQLFDRCYRAGALVFGGGHVVLPLLRAAVVPPGWLGDDRFMAGYGAAQAVPGPLFSFAAYIGAASSRAPAGWTGAAIALVAIFLPGFLLVVGALPYWERLRRLAPMRRALQGINAAVVGLLLAAFLGPVWTRAVLRPPDAAAVAVAVVLLVAWKMPPWLLVLGCAAAAAAGLV
ncbi:MAG: chromate efflux transporter [Burkholderiales bacterium]|nr:chromate efflux transporter [Burkholderiales bacterium]MDE2502466.1 chromate efflux transporter [Burkholderiales bacterium]